MYMYIYTWMCRMLIEGASVYDIYKYTYRSVCVYIQVHMYMYIYTWMCRMLIQGASVYDNLFLFFLFFISYTYTWMCRMLTEGASAAYSQKSSC